MPKDHEGILEEVYTAKSESELIAAYDVWAASYDSDLVSFGYKVPSIVAGFFGRHVGPQDTPILDAGAGTGMISEGLAYLGYHGMTAIDLSDGMLEVARQKGIYDQVIKMRLGDRLDFEDGYFAATVCAGTLTTGHVKADAFDELIRVTRTGGHVIFSVRVDGDSGAQYLVRQDELEAMEMWAMKDKTEPFRSMPLGEPDVLHQVFVYQVN